MNNTKSKIQDELDLVNHAIKTGKKDFGYYKKLLLTLNEISDLEIHEDIVAKLKTTTILDTQKAYFALIESFFGDFYIETIKKGLTPSQYASHLSHNNQFVNNFYKNEIEEFREAIVNFWSLNAPIVEFHLRQLQTLKTTQGGEFLPSLDSGFISRTGVYVQTLLLSDPLIRIVYMIEGFKPSTVVHLLFEKALMALEYKPYVLEELDIPFVIFTHDYFPMYQDLVDYHWKISNAENLIHLGEAFNKDFKSEKELDKFLNTINSLEELELAVRDSNKVLSQIEANLSFRENWEKSYDDYKILKDLNYKSPSIRDSVKLNSFSRISQVNELLSKSSLLDSIPTFTSSSSWEYLKWKVQRINFSSGSKFHSKEFSVVSALQNDQLAWIGNIPPEKLIQVRKSGEFEDIRQMLSKNILKLQSLDEIGIKSQAKEIEENIKEEFTRHNEMIIKTARMDGKIVGYKLTPWLIFGSISILSTTLPNNILLKDLASLGTLFGSSNIFDIVESIHNLRSNRKNLDKKSINLFFDAQKEN